jgi:WD40 repeat protein
LPAARVLCVMGGAGSGKSTVSAAVFRDVLAHEQYILSLLGKKLHYSYGRGPSFVTAVHFCKQTDQRRQEPIGIVQSLAFQLALQLPDLAESLLRAKIGRFRTLEECCSVFMPLMAKAASAQHVVILLDALDEADPPEQLRPGFDASKGVEAVGNKTLRILLAFLATGLPKNVRFILATRPEAALGDIRILLDRAFKSEGGVLYVEPHALRHQEGASLAVERNFVHDTLVRECNLQQTRAVNVPTLADLHSVYETMFDSCESTTGAIALLQVLMAASEPLPMSLLQQMGLSEHLDTIPGWGVLFFVSEHRLYTLHKSLIDWLHANVLQASQRSKISGWSSAELAVGHSLLAAHLLEHEILPASEGSESTKAVEASEYASRYAMVHLCSTKGELGSRLRDAALGWWPYLRQVFERGHGPVLLKALGGTPQHELSLYARDALSWLRRCYNDFELQPSDMARTTFRHAPIYSDKYDEAVRALKAPRTRHVLGKVAQDRWPMDTMILKGHAGGVTSVAISADRRTVATGSVDKTARLWDVASGQCTATLEGHSGEVTSVAMSADGRTVETGSVDMTARLWDVASGQCTATLVGHTNGVTSVAISADGRTVVTGSGDMTARLWDVASGQCTAMLAGHAGGVTSLAISADGRTVVTGSEDETARLWDVASGQCTVMLEGHTLDLTSVAMSADGWTVVTGSEDMTARLWDVASGRCTATLEGHTLGVDSVAMTADGRTVVTGSDKVRLWDVASGRCTATLEGVGRVKSVAISGDGRGRTVATVSEKVTRLWDVASGQYTTTLEGHTDSVDSVAMTRSADRRTVATGSYDMTVRLWDVASGQCTATLEGHTYEVTSVAISADGRTVATGSGDMTARLWDMASGQCVAILAGHAGGVTDVAMSADGRTVATGSVDMTARLWTCQCTTPIRLTEVPSPMAVHHGVSCDASGMSPIIGTRYHKIDADYDLCEAEFTKLSEVEKSMYKKIDQPRNSLRTEAVQFTDRENDHSILVVRDGRLEWHTNRSLELRAVPALELTMRDGYQTLLVPGNSRLVARLHDPPSGAVRERMLRYLAVLAQQTGVSLTGFERFTSAHCTATLEGHSGEVNSVAMSADGRTVATGSVDKTARLWDVASGQCTATLVGHAYNVMSVAMSADGRMVATGSVDMTARLWDVASGQCTMTLEGHAYNVNSVAISADGRTVVTGSGDMTARLWDVASGQCTATLEGHTNGVTSVAISADGRTVVTGSVDMTARLWDMASDWCTATLEGGDGLEMAQVCALSEHARLRSSTR